MKRLLICALALGLIALGPSPVSTCAILSGAMGDCASAETRSHCDTMDMGEQAAQGISSQPVSCCAISQPPLPEFKTELSKTTVTLELVVAPTPTADIVNSEGVRLHNVAEEFSPPPLRSLLCTLLI